MSEVPLYLEFLGGFGLGRNAPDLVGVQGDDRYRPIVAAQSCVADSEDRKHQVSDQIRSEHQQRRRRCSHISEHHIRGRQRGRQG